jgi:ABC-2 type transport system permease protein
MRRFLAILKARNLEFWRDRSSLGWNIAFPFLLVIALAFILSDEERDVFKVAVLGEPTIAAQSFLETRYVEFIPVSDEADAVHKVGRHQLDMLLDLRGEPRYWINTTSPRGYVLERLLTGAFDGPLEKRGIEREEVRYRDWVLPGVLGMNMMFSCLFGVGYVIVRYRKSGYLKRLYATPLRAIEFIAAQLVSRMFIILAITAGVYVGADLLIGFEMVGSHLVLLLVAAAGGMAMVSLGLLVAARVTSEELAGGLLNLFSWPMMLLSGVFFSLEGTHAVVQWVSKVFPLTHLLTAARKVMLDGAGVGDVMPELVVLTAMTVVALSASALVFRWRAG